MQKSIKMASIYAKMLITLLCVMIPVNADSYRCGACECDPVFGVVNCRSRNLRWTPDVKSLNGNHFKKIDLRNNHISFVDFAPLRKFRTIVLSDNNLDCDHGLINVDVLNPWNVVISDCEQLTNLEYINNSEMEFTTVEPDTSSTSQKGKAHGTLKTDGNIVGNLESHYSGKFELSWGLNLTLTIMGVLSGVVGGMYSLRTILKKLKIIDEKLVQNSDANDISQRPNYRGCTLNGHPTQNQANFACTRPHRPPSRPPQPFKRFAPMPPPQAPASCVGSEEDLQSRFEEVSLHSADEQSLESFRSYRDANDYETDDTDGEIY